MIGAPIGIAVFILLTAHLSVDRDFPPAVKNGAWAVFIIVLVLYVLFGLIF